MRLRLSEEEQAMRAGALGAAGVSLLEGLAAAPAAERRVRVPTLTDPRGLDVRVYRRLGQSEAMRALEARAIAVLKAFGVLMTDTCITYQTIMPPVRGEHLAPGDTGVARLQPGQPDSGAGRRLRRRDVGRSLR